MSGTLGLVQPAAPVPATDAPLVEPEVRRSANGVLSTSLRCAYAYRDIGGKRLYLRSYEGGSPGPTLRMKPGETLKIRLINDLPPNRDQVPQDFTRPHQFNNTNGRWREMKVSRRARQTPPAHGPAAAGSWRTILKTRRRHSTDQAGAVQGGDNPGTDIATSRKELLQEAHLLADRVTQRIVEPEIVRSRRRHGVAIAPPGEPGAIRIAPDLAGEIAEVPDGRAAERLFERLALAPGLRPVRQRRSPAR